jgi:hypothetical protein
MRTSRAGLVWTDCKPEDIKEIEMPLDPNGIHHAHAGLHIFDASMLI